LAQATESAERTDQELMLLVILGVALRAVKGFSDPEVGEVFERARALFSHSGQTMQMVPVLRGLWEFYEVQANYAQALPYAEQLLELAEHLGDDGIKAVACDTMGDTSVWMGEFERAWLHLERGISLYDPEKHRGHLFLYGYDTGMACMTYGAIALWNLGRPTEARALMESARAIGERLKHPMTRAFVGIMGSWLYRLMGDLTKAEADGEMAVRVSQEHGLPFFLGWGMITRGWARVGIGWVDDGLRDIEEGMAIYKSTDSQLAVSLWHWALAEAYVAAGRQAEAVRVLDEALAFVERTGERVCERELREMRGRFV
jgi:adenylate cyclase